jgi:hypothetical protein
MSFELGELTIEFAAALKVVDGRGPIARNTRSKKSFRPGIGPHSESAAMSLILLEMISGHPYKYDPYRSSVQYPGTQQKCDVCFGSGPEWEWAIEIKLLRFAGDNDKPNDHMLMHLLSPYAEHRSALTDLDKLQRWSDPKRKAILIYGFDHWRWPLEPAVRAFEDLAKSRASLSGRFECSFSGLMHPVHTAGAVVAWEILTSEANQGTQL